MKVLFSLIIFCTLLSAGMTISCYRSHKNGTILENCDRFRPKCASVSYNQTVIPYLEKINDEKLCVPKTCVTGEIGFSSTNGKHFHMNTRCCDTNACNEDFVGLPAREPNGMKCPACFLLKKRYCRSKENITCNSAETQCIEFTGSLSFGIQSKGRFAMKGCATPSFCDVSKRSFENNGTRKETTLGISIVSSKARCYPALPESETDLE